MTRPSDLTVRHEATHDVWLLHRPHKRNALTFAMLHALERAADDAEARGVSVVVLSASPGTSVFCAGSDLHELTTLGAREATADRPFESPIHHMLARLDKREFTLICAINGSAHGAGVELALLGDVCIAAPDVTFLLPPSKLGVVYPASGLARLERTIGAALLRAMLVTAIPVSAARLHQAGALFSLADDPLAEAEQLARTIAPFPAQARVANARLGRG